MKTNIIKKALSFIAAAFITIAASDAQAVTFLWNNTGTNWTSPASWTNGVQPASTSSSTTTDEIQFGNFGASNNTVVLTSTRATRNITFVTNANAYAINSFNGAQILSSSGGITNNSTAIQTFNILVENANNSNTWFQTAGGGLVFNNVASLTTASSGTSRTLTLAGDGAFTFNNELKQGGTSTAGKVLYTGGGTVTFNGTNTLGGGFEIRGAGVVNVNGGTGLGTGLITMAAATGTTNQSPKLVINTSNGLSVANSFKGSSSTSTMATLDLLAGNDTNAVMTFVVNQYQGNNMTFTNHGAGKTLLQFTNVANTLTSSTDATGGRRLINNSANLTVQFDGTLDIGSTVADANTIGGAGDFLFKGSLLNTAGVLRGLTKTGTGTVTLQAVNAYNGDTTIQTGTLLVDTAGSIASSTAIVSGGTLQVKGVAGVATVNSGSLLVNSGGTIGTTTVGGGTLLVDGTAGNVTVNSGTATVNFGGSIGSTTINGSLLTMNGTAGDVEVNSGGSLGGEGTVGAVTLKDGSFLNPGNSPGLLTAASSTWAAGSTYNWEINQASGGTAGENWDLFVVTGTLDLSALSSTAQMNLVLQSLPAMDDFFTTTPYSWVIAQAGSFTGTGLTNGADVTNLFNINATAFNGGNLPANGFKVEVGTSGDLRTLNLMAIPEPSAGFLMAFAAIGLMTLRMMRKK